MEQGGASADTKHYLYGVQCIGEQVDTDDSEKAEWRYYHRDGNNLVRQATNSAAEITLAWAYSPEGAVLIGEKGPVTNLGCGDIYDWSTGLVYKGGRYFDPNLGIWTTLTPYLIWQNYKTQKRAGKSRRKRRSRRKLILLLLVLLVVALALSACNDPPGPSADATPCPTTPTVPPPLPANDDWEIKQRTVQIIRDVPPNLSRLSLGTVIEDGSAIITHNHFMPGKAEKVVISDRANRVLVTFTDEDDIHKSEINEQTLRWQLPEKLEGSTRIAQIGSSSALKVGDAVSVPYRNNNGRIEIKHTTIHRKGVYDGTHVAVMPNDGFLIKGGDSGGGLFHHGKIVGNTWEMTTGERDSPHVFISALLPP
jgi:hypothetical protein